MAPAVPSAAAKRAFQERDTMSNTMSKPGLDPIEHASIDELRACSSSA